MGLGKRSPAIRAAGLGGILAVLLYAMVARYVTLPPWAAGKNERRVADSPHCIFVASCWRELIHGGGVYLNIPFPADNLNDFKRVSERPADAAAPTANLPRGPKNVIVVVLESVGTQFLSVYGSEFPTTKNLEAEAEAGNCLIYDNFYSHMTNTPNSLVAMTLSTYPTMTWREWTVEKPDLKGTAPAQVLSAAGYRTAFISAGNDNFANQAAFLKNRGFDDVWDYRNAAEPPPPAWEFSWGVRDKCMVDMILKWLDQDSAGQKPFYIYSWNQGTHHPYYAGPDHATQTFLRNDAEKQFWGKMWWDLGNYLNALHEMDIQLGRLLKELRARGRDKDTIVIVVGDHGEAFGPPHNTYGHAGHVYQENVNVPMLIWSPALFKDRPREKTVVGAHVDLNPTIFDLLNMPCPGDWQGHSLFDPNRPQRLLLWRYGLPSLRRARREVEVHLQQDGGGTDAVRSRHRSPRRAGPVGQQRQHLPAASSADCRLGELSEWIETVSVVWVYSPTACSCSPWWASRPPLRIFIPRPRPALAAPPPP